MFKVLIDPGHGLGNVNGGRNGYKEHIGMFKLSQYLKTALEQRGVKADLTRAESEDPALVTRGKMAKGYDLFISEHSNASGSGSVQGVECFHSVDLPGDKPLAAALSKACAAVMGNADRGAKTRPSTKNPGEDYYTVIDAAQDAGCPHVLLNENGFHDNAADELFLLKDENLRLLADAQADAICKTLNIVDPPIASEPDAPAAPDAFNLCIGNESVIVPAEYIGNIWWLIMPGGVAVKVRDVLDTLGFAVTWDGNTCTITAFKKH
jgi:N-acetylmuramoyl-L-alanine amidase